jgi:succinyl-CoA synthetase beta subunit
MQLVTHQTGPEGKKVGRLLLEQGVDIAKEFYAAVVLDRQKGRLAARKEAWTSRKWPTRRPEQIHQSVHVDPTLGVRGYQTTYLAQRMGLPREVWRDFHNIVREPLQLLIRPTTPR